MAYFSNTTTSNFLSRDACIALGIIPKGFPHEQVHAIKPVQDKMGAGQNAMKFGNDHMKQNIVNRDAGQNAMKFGNDQMKRNIVNGDAGQNAVTFGNDHTKRNIVNGDAGQNAMEKENGHMKQNMVSGEFGQNTIKVEVDNPIFISRIVTIVKAS